MVFLYKGSIFSLSAIKVQDQKGGAVRWGGLLFIENL